MVFYTLNASFREERGRCSQTGTTERVVIPAGPVLVNKARAGSVHRLWDWRAG